MNILIVEDEAPIAAFLKEIIEQEGDFMVTGIAESVEEAVRYLSKYQHNLDLLFFDIQLADGPSFEIFRHIDVVVPIVFCTAYNEFSLQAIKNNGIDYVLKPFKEKEIREALEKYRRLRATLSPRQRPENSLAGLLPPSYQKSFLTQAREKSLVIPVEDIALFQVAHETVYLHTFAGEKLPLFKRMEYIESVCDPVHFFRINRQMLVNRSAIQSFEPYFQRKIILQLSIPLEEGPIVSRLKVAAFKAWLEQ
ncbi:MAG: LytTR family DNA-binding domain-containing protein [Bacteroidota bacterium]